MAKIAWKRLVFLLFMDLVASFGVDGVGAYHEVFSWSFLLLSHFGGEIRQLYSMLISVDLWVF